MPLRLGTKGNTYTIQRIRGDEALKKHLEHLGFVPGTVITIVSECMGNLIVQVLGSRVAVSKEMAERIMI